MKGIFGDLFDFNDNGKTDIEELAAELLVLEDAPVKTDEEDRDPFTDDEYDDCGFADDDF